MRTQNIAHLGRVQTSARVLTATLALVYTFNFLDRQIILILGQAIKQELSLSDQQLGFLGGAAFAIFYACLGIPVARLAERFNRIWIIAFAVAIWSGMTYLCGMAGSYSQLFLARIGVGVGEAGCTPAAHSLIADCFPPSKRSSALAAYSLGIPLGTILGVVGGGWLGQIYGWRRVFFIVGLPGIVLAIVVRLILREPQRGRFDPAAASTPPPILSVLRTLLTNPVYVHLLIGLTLCTFASAGVGTFTPPFLLRGGFASLRELSLVIGLASGLAALAGTLAGGVLADWAGKHDSRAYLLIPAGCFAIATPVFIAAFLQTRLVPFTILSSVGNFFGLVYLGPSFAVIHNIVEPRMRASAIAFTFLVVSLLGIGLGPVAIGTLSDVFARHYGSSLAWQLSCAAASSSNDCRSASLFGVTLALICGSCVYLWAGIHYRKAASRLARN